MATSRAGVSSSPSSSSLSADSESESSEIESSVSASEPYLSLTAHDGIKNQRGALCARVACLQQLRRGKLRTFRELLAFFAILKRFCIVLVDCELV